MTRAPDEFDQTILSLEAGELLSNRYRLLRELGRGGMGIVWLAEDTTLDDRKVAIKLLPTALTMNARAVARLKKEAATCLELTHTHIVRLLNFEQDESRGKLAFLVMQYVDGHTLDDLLADHPDGLPLERVLKWAPQIAQALDHAHEKGVLHRDIKPSNIMIDGDDNAYLMDFGIAREAKDTMTRVTGRESSGTLPYMSPQHLDGKNSTSNDIYSLAATLYEAISGEPPFTTGDFYQQIKNVQASAISSQPREINNALLSGLAKQPNDRPASALDLMKALQGESYECGETMPDTNADVLPQITSSNRGRRTILTIVTLAILCVSVIGVVSWQQEWWLPASPYRRAEDLREIQLRVGHLRQECEILPDDRNEIVQQLLQHGQNYERIADANQQAKDFRTAGPVLEEAQLAYETALSADAADRVRRDIENQFKSIEPFDHPLLNPEYSHIQQQLIESATLFSSGQYDRASAAWSALRARVVDIESATIAARTAHTSQERWQTVLTDIPEVWYNEVAAHATSLIMGQSQTSDLFAKAEFATATDLWNDATDNLESAIELHRVAEATATEVRDEWNAAELFLPDPLYLGLKERLIAVHANVQAADSSFTAGEFDEARRRWSDSISESSSLVEAHSRALVRLEASRSEWNTVSSLAPKKWPQIPFVLQLRDAALGRVKDVDRLKGDGDFDQANSRYEEACSSFVEACIEAASKLLESSETDLDGFIVLEQIVAHDADNQKAGSLLSRYRKAITRKRHLLRIRELYFEGSFPMEDLLLVQAILTVDTDLLDEVDSKIAQHVASIIDGNVSARSLRPYLDILEALEARIQRKQSLLVRQQIRDLLDVAMAATDDDEVWAAVGQVLSLDETNTRAIEIKSALKRKYEIGPKYRKSIGTIRAAAGKTASRAFELPYADKSVHITVGMKVPNNIASSSRPRREVTATRATTHWDDWLRGDPIEINATVTDSDVHYEGLAEVSANSCAWYGRRYAIDWDREKDYPRRSTTTFTRTIDCKEFKIEIHGIVGRQEKVNYVYDRNRTLYKVVNVSVTDVEISTFILRPGM